MAVAAPGLLLAGGVLAAIPVVLHLLSRRPPGRVALPTARFLSEDPRTLLRLRRTPTHLPLMILRVLFALALGAAFAGLRWVPERTGSRQVILVDAGADSLVEWSSVAAAVEAAVAQVASDPGPPGVSSSGDGEGEPPLVIAYGLDDGPRVVTADEVPEVRRGSSPATLEEGLRALRREAAASRFAHAEVTWVGRPSWRIWSPAVGLMRPVLWPGHLRFRSVEEAGAGSLAGDWAASASPGTAREAAPRVRIAVGSESGALGRAVTALGGRVVDATDGGLGSSPDWIVAEMASEGFESWLPDVRTGATLVAFGHPTAGSPDLPWAAPRSQPRQGTAALLVLDGDRSVGGVVPRAPGFPATGSRTLLTFDDGTPAAAARDVGEGCVVFFAAALTDTALTRSPAYPELLRTLVLGCRETDFGDASLDRGALQVLERPDLPATVAVAAILAPEGRELTRWLLLAALGLLGLEVFLTWSRGRRTHSFAAPRGGDPW